jgi:hypothetical protein
MTLNVALACGKPIRSRRFETGKRAAGATRSGLAQIARLGMDPRLVPPMRGVGISWLRRAADGSPDIAASRQAAQDMVNDYGMVFIAKLASRHTERRAIDMTISWNGDLQITDAQGARNRIDTEPRDGTNPRLHTVARTYGVIKLLGDPVHWSDDGH